MRSVEGAPAEPPSEKRHGHTHTSPRLFQPDREGIREEQAPVLEEVLEPSIWDEVLEDLLSSFDLDLLDLEEDAPEIAGDAEGDQHIRASQGDGVAEVDAVLSAVSASPGVASQEDLVACLLNEGIVTQQQADTAIQEAPAGTPVWRQLLEMPAVSSRRVLGAVAKASGYFTVEINSMQPLAEFIHDARELFPNLVGKAMLDLNMLPIEVSIHPESGRYKLLVATHDPLNPVIQAFAGRFDIHVELRYAAQEALEQRILELRMDLEWLKADFDTGLSPSDSEASPLFGDGFASQEEPALTPRDQPQEANPSRTAQPAAADTADGRDDTLPGTLDPVSPEKALGEAPEAGNKKAARAKVVDVNQVKDRVVTTLLSKQGVSQEQVAEAVYLQRGSEAKEALWRLLAQVPGVDRERVYAEAARIYAFPTAEVGAGKPDPEFMLLIMETIAEERRDDLLRLRLLPIEYDVDPQNGGARLVFMTHDPARPEVHRTLQQLKLGRFELQYAPESIITGLIQEIFPRKNEYLERMTEDPMAYDLGMNYEEDEERFDEEALEAEISRSTLINLFEASLIEAVRQGASDLHIYPNSRRQIEIHFRVDGRLKRWHVEEKVHPESYLAVVKDNAMNVDRFERDSAQDGFIQRKIDDALIRFRVSILPIASASQELRAESIVIRVLDDRKVLTDLSKLGMLDVAMERFEKAIRQPHGMVILTGPTGSGKSTTLVAALHQVVTPEVNVLTVEDPVEYIIKNVRQIKLSHKLGLEGALRAILRHDPDVVMVGEMRDKETAELAVKLANTGHLTFSTLHTNDAPSAVSRLYKMGIEPFLIGYAINLIVAQRLLRTLCPSCKKEDDDPDFVMMKQLGFTPEDFANITFYKPSHDKKCPTCNGNGFKGRRAICETLYFSRAIRHLIVESGEAIDEDAIRDQAMSEGMLTLADSARELVKMGETSVDEMVRVTSSED